ncbi:hypothetical protein E4K10_46405 [Streptomyces sp. T1317-0309]|nr:hypothetical protein E4K10_46405 [Streptomyces sp. T1317-0309]
MVRQTALDATRELRRAFGVLGMLGRDTGPETLTDSTCAHADIETPVAKSQNGEIARTTGVDGSDLDAHPARVYRAAHSWYGSS